MTKKIKVEKLTNIQLGEPENFTKPYTSEASRILLTEVFGSSMISSTSSVYSHLLIAFDMGFPFLINGLENEYSEKSQQEKEAIICIMARINKKISNWIKTNHENPVPSFEWDDERIWWPFNEEQRIYVKQTFTNLNSFFKIWNKLSLGKKYLKDRKWVGYKREFAAFAAVLIDTTLVTKPIKPLDFLKALLIIFYGDIENLVTVNQEFGKRNKKEIHDPLPVKLFEWIKKI
jgi:hypothetical protein